MLEQQINHRLAGHIMARVETQGLKIFVLAHQVCGRIGEHIHDPFKACSIERCFQVFDNVELDAALAQNIERSTRLPSAGVVIDLESFHGNYLLASDIGCTLTGVSVVRQPLCEERCRGESETRPYDGRQISLPVGNNPGVQILLVAPHQPIA
jgi:hypothetical protein